MCAVYVILTQSEKKIYSWVVRQIKYTADLRGMFSENIILYKIMGYVLLSVIYCYLEESHFAIIIFGN